MASDFGLSFSSSRMLAVPLLGLAACFSFWADRSSGGQIRTVALSDQIAPGFDEPFDWIIDSGIAINDRGSIVFRGAVGDTRTYGVWTEVDGTLSLAVAQGGDAPGTTDKFGAFDSSDFVFARAVITDRDDLYFAATVRDDVSSRFGIWAQPALGSKSLVAITQEDLAPPAYQLTGHHRFNVNDNGDVVVEALDWSASSFALMRGRAGDQFSFLAQESQPVGVGDYHYESIPRSSIHLGDNGSSVIAATLGDSGFGEYAGLILARPGEASELIAVQNVGGSVDGARTSHTYRRGGLNDRDTVVYLDQRTSRDRVEAFQQSLWKWRPGEDSVLLAQTGVEHDELGVTFARIGNSAVNGSDQTAFLANTVMPDGGTSQQGLWLERPGGGLFPVAEPGGDAPGTAAQFMSVSKFAVNGRGQVVFQGNLEGEDVTDYNYSGIWATDADGELQLIVRYGQTLDVSPFPSSPDLRVIDYASFASDLSSSGLEDGRASPFNEAGEILFYARFTDGTTGVFVSRLVAVPEPSVTLLAWVAALAAAGGGRRRA